MRGPSAWSVVDRELMGAFIAKANQCEFSMRDILPCTVPRPLMRALNIFSPADTAEDLRWPYGFEITAVVVLTDVSWVTENRRRWTRKLIGTGFIRKKHRIR